MASAKASVKNISISARKARLVADLIRGKRVVDARNVLHVTLKRSALPIRKLLDSAVANAENAAAEAHERIDTDDMVVDTIMVNEGRTLHRIQPQSRGRALRIRKRSSHVELTITEK